jgi:hypothetical protein
MYFHAEPPAAFQSAFLASVFGLSNNSGSLTFREPLSYALKSFSNWAKNSLWSPVFIADCEK